MDSVLAATEVTPPSFAKLTEHNYTKWMGNMRAYLIMKNVWRIVIGDEKAPTDADKLEKFTLRQGIAFGAIFLSLDSQQQKHVSDTTLFGRHCSQFMFARTPPLALLPTMPSSVSGRRMTSHCNPWLAVSMI